MTENSYSHCPWIIASDMADEKTINNIKYSLCKHMDIWHAFQEKFDFDDTVTLLKQNGIEANRWWDACFWCRETICMPKPLAFVFSM